MDYTDNFEGTPAFPEDVQTAPLLRLSLDKLLRHDEAELKRMCNACEEIGFFYMDLRGTRNGDNILENADRLFAIEQELFDLSLEEKQRYDFSKEGSYFGYKSQGASVVDKKGNLDRNEFYNVSISPSPTPSAVTDYNMFV